MTENEIQDFAGDVRTGAGARPAWVTKLAYFLVLGGILYFILTAGAGGLDGPNSIILAVLVIWLIYTPLAVRKGWFAIRL